MLESRRAGYTASGVRIPPLSAASEFRRTPIPGTWVNRHPFLAWLLHFRGRIRAQPQGDVSGLHRLPDYAR